MTVFVRVNKERERKREALESGHLQTVDSSCFLIHCPSKENSVPATKKEKKRKIQLKNVMERNIKIGDTLNACSDTSHCSNPYTPIYN